jgi:hypothetical protein
MSAISTSSARIEQVELLTRQHALPGAERLGAACRCSRPSTVCERRKRCVAVAVVTWSLTMPTPA